VNAEKKQRLNLVRLLSPYWKQFLLGIIAVVIQALTDLLQPWPLKIVVDLVGEKPMPGWLSGWVAALFGADKLAVLTFIAVAVVVIAVLAAIASYVESVSMMGVGQWVTHDLRSTLYHHIQRLSLSYHDRSQTGDLISRVTSDIDTIQGFITSTLTDVILDILTLVSMYRNGHHVKEKRLMSSRQRRSWLVVLAARQARKRSRLDHVRVERRRHVAAVDDVSDHDVDVALAISAGVRRRRLAPAAVEQDSDSLQPRRRRKFWLAHDRGEVTNTLRGVCSAQ